MVVYALPYINSISAMSGIPYECVVVVFVYKERNTIDKSNKRNTLSRKYMGQFTIAKSSNIYKKL